MHLNYLAAVQATMLLPLTARVKIAQSHHLQL